MGFLRKLFRAEPRPNAQELCVRIAEGFKTVRKWQFESAVKAIEGRLGHELRTLRRSLGGDADCALKGYQLWITTAFLVAHPYIPQAEREKFFGLLSTVVSRQDWKVLDYTQTLHEYRSDPPEQFVRVAFPVANYITSIPHPVAATLVARLMPLFIGNTEMVIADSFGDRATLKELESGMQLIRRKLVGG